MKTPQNTTTLLVEEMKEDDSLEDSQGSAKLDRFHDQESSTDKNFAFVDRANTLEFSQSTLPSMQTVEWEYVENECIIESTFRIPEIGNEEEYYIITEFYDELGKLNPHNTLILLKCLIAYDKRSHIDKIYNRLKEHENTGSVALIHDAKKAGQMYSAYNSNEFIRDIVLYAINSDEIILVLQLIEKYKIILGLYCIQITEAVINCIEKQIDEETQLTYPLEKLLVIEVVCKRFAADSSSVIKFLRVYQKLASQPDDINFIVNYYNPFRMYVTLQRVSRVMLNSVGTGENAFQSLVDAYEELILKIIDEVDVASVIRNWLLDEAGENYKVIDYLAQFDCLNIISHVKVLKVCEQIWNGTFDVLQNYGIKDTVKKSAAITTFTTFNVRMDTAGKYCCE